MKPFTRNRQGGWLGIAAAVVGGIASSYGQQSSQSRQSKLNYQDQSDLSNLNFQQQSWLVQQSHKWDLEDFAMQHNYNKSLIAGFEPYAGPNKADPNGQWQAPPQPVDVSQYTNGLAPTDANGQPYIIDPRTGKPMLGAAQGTNQPAALQPPGNVGQLTTYGG